MRGSDQIKIVSLIHKIFFMHYYNQQVTKLNSELYSKEYLTNKVIAGKQFIDLHYMGSINIDAVSTVCCISKFHFIRLFKKYYGLTPYQYLTEIRIAKAKQLLQQNTSVAEISFMLGFDCISSLSELFKKFTGITPTQFRKKAIFPK